MKNRLSSVLQLAWGLLSDPVSYQVFLKYSKWQLVWFYLISVIVLSGLWSSRVLIRQLPIWQEKTSQAVAEFTSYYPEALVVAWDGDHLSLTPEQPYSVYFPSFIDEGELRLPDLLAYFTPEVIDDTATSSATSLSTYALVTPTQIMLKDNDGGWSAFALSELLPPDQTWSLTKTQLLGKLDELTTTPAVWNQAKITVAIISIPLLLWMTTWSVIVQSLLAYLILIKLYRANITGKQLLRICLPITVVASAIQLIAELLYQNVSFSLFGITFWLILFLVTRALFFKPKL